MNPVAQPARARRTSESRACPSPMLCRPASCWDPPGRAGSSHPVNAASTTPKVTAPAVCCWHSGCTAAQREVSLGNHLSFSPFAVPVRCPRTTLSGTALGMAQGIYLVFFKKRCFLMFLLKPDQIPARVQGLAQMRRQGQKVAMP